jgi:hypothetical protein
MRDRSDTLGYEENGQQMASNSPRVVGKNDSRYWRAKIFKLTDPRGGELAHWATRIQWRGKRHRFALGTANKEAAAAKAAAIWRDLVAHGFEVTLAKHRSAVKDAQASIAATTIGEWISAAGEVWDGKPATFGGYARALRFIASEILSLSKNSKRFGRTQARAYREQVDGVPLAMLSPQAIQAWRIRYLSQAGDNPVRRRAARISCNSALRLARSLFSQRILKFTTRRSFRRSFLLRALSSSRGNRCAIRASSIRQVSCGRLHAN